jgi:hypothetical protein
MRGDRVGVAVPRVTGEADLAALGDGGGRACSGERVLIRSAWRCDVCRVANSTRSAPLGDVDREIHRRASPDERVAALTTIEAMG